MSYLGRNVRPSLGLQGIFSRKTNLPGTVYSNYHRQVVSTASLHVKHDLNLKTSSNTIKLKKILIANRGEIACRVIRTAKRLGIRTVAVYSDADANSDHVKLADEAVHLGPSPASQSYLRGDKIVEACLKTGAQAVHPGYGFLSENLQFCEQCREANIIFIGPPPNAIRAMGSKSESKEIMIKAGVPVTPGYHGSDQSNERLFAEAKKIGFPMMIKAVSGGGGKGMRAVYESEKFIESLESCRREAKRSFNDDAVLLEKLIQAPRHVEVQVFGGPDGKAVHLLERDCSVQRRHQKVLEEAPAPNLDPKTRAEMHKAAVACAEAVGYRGAGTVEFLIDSVTKEFYFCEMNTRLQVEHPVTEMITGNDLVEWQLLVAAGFPIPLSQEEIIARSKGCAIEARIYAENPIKDFLPATGVVTHIRNPAVHSDEPGVRVDTGISQGNTISTFYDPMIAKLIAFAETREKALDKLERSLRSYQVSGLSNNINFLVRTVQRNDFVEAKATTAFFEKNMQDILKSLQSLEKQEVIPFSIFGAVAMLLAQQVTTKAAGIWSGSNEQISGWRQVSHAQRSFDFVSASGETLKVHIVANGDNSLSLVVSSKGETNGKAIRTNVQLVNKRIETLKGSVVLDLSLKLESHLLCGTVSIYSNDVAKLDVIDIWLDGRSGEEKTHYQLQSHHSSFSESSGASSNPVVLSPMPGKVVKVVVTDGQEVKRGDTIAVIEAMKMEHSVVAPSDGVVKVWVTEGANVGDGSKIAEVVASAK